MEEAATADRQSLMKRIAMMGDDSASEQPVEKMTKKDEEAVLDSPSPSIDVDKFLRELNRKNDLPEPLLPTPPPPPSNELVELLKKLQEKEELFQCASQAAHNAEQRAEQAEKLLAANRFELATLYGKQMAEQEKRLTDLAAQFDEARRNAEDSEASKLEFARENDRLSAENAEFRSEEDRLVGVIAELEADKLALSGELKQMRDNFEQLEAEMRKYQEDTEKKIDTLLTVNAKIEARFKEVRKKAKALESADIVREYNDVKEELKKMTDEMSKVKEDLGRARREKQRANCRKLILYHTNAELQVKLEETNSRTEQMAGGMANLLAQCGMISPPQQPQPQQPNRRAGPSPAAPQPLPRSTIMSRRFVDVVTVESDGSGSENSNDSPAISPNNTPGQLQIEQRAQCDCEAIAAAAAAAAEEMAALQQRLLKSEDMCTRAVRAAGDAELRAVRAENQLETKRVALQGARTNAEVEQRLTSELNEARTKANEMQHEINSLSKNNAEAWKKLDAVREEEGRKVWNLQQQVQQLQQLRYDQQQPAMIMGPSFDAGVAQQWMPMASQPIVLQRAGSSFDDMNGSQQLSQWARLSDTAHSTNILEPCHPNIFNVITIDLAVAQIDAKFEEYRLRGLPSVQEMLNNYYSTRYRSTKMVNVVCLLCGASFENQSTLFHFKSPQHLRNARAHQSAVSEPALRFWLRKLQHAADAAAEDAAAAAVGGDVVAAAAAAAAPTDDAVIKKGC